MEDPGDKTANLELIEAQEALEVALRDSTTNTWFGAPVDAVGLGLEDYFDIVKQPKDLGTILADLNDKKYATALDVWNDICLVWRNCRAYNSRPEDDDIRKICKRSEKLMTKEWASRDLPMDTSELDLDESGPVQNAPDAAPAKEAEPKDTSPMDLRLLSSFTVRYDGQLIGLERHQPPPARIIISGDVVAATADPSGTLEKIGAVTDTTVIDWVVQYSEQETCMWVITDAAWFKLLKPATEYALTFAGTQRAVALAQTAMKLLQEAGGDVQDLGALVERAIVNLPGDAASNKQLVTKETKEFALSQLQGKLGRYRRRKTRKRRLDAGGIPGLKRPRGMGRFGSRGRLGTDGMDFDMYGGMSDDDMPDDFMPSDEEDAASKSRKKAWRRIKYWKRRVEEEEAKKKEEEARLAKEKAEDELRGEPPQPVRDFRVPMHLVAELLNLWELCQTYGDVLLLPPFPLSALEASLGPGPRLGKAADDGSEDSGSNPAGASKETTPGVVKKEGGTSAKKSSASKAAAQNVISDPTVKTRRQRVDSSDQLDAKDMAEKLNAKYGLSADQVKNLVPLDRDAAASGLLIRDIFCSLMKAAYATPLPPLGTLQPPIAKLETDEPDQPHPWPERVANSLWDPRFGAPMPAKEAALKLAYGDLVDLSAEEKIGMMSALAYAAINAEPLALEIAARVEKMIEEDRVGWEGRAPDEDDIHITDFRLPKNPKILDNPVAVAAAAVNAAAAAAGGDATPGQQRQIQLSDWATWAANSKTGIRRPLGIDARGRRYWVLGKDAGAYRVYVEEDEGKLWGWYEGPEIKMVLKWLQSANIKSEHPLITALKGIPLPIDVKAPERLLVGDQLVKTRADGYKQFYWPFLRGEWNKRSETPIVAADKRVALAVDALLGAVPFWFKGPDAALTHFAITETLNGSQYNRDAHRALLETEKMLADAGRLSDEWLDVWQAPWRRGVATLADVKEIPLYTASLETHTLCHPDVVPRQAFLKFAIDASCPLLFPFPGDTIVVLRTGLLKHIERYMALLGLIPMPENFSNKPRRPVAAAVVEAEPVIEVGEDGEVIKPRRRGRPPRNPASIQAAQMAAAIQHQQLSMRGRAAALSSPQFLGGAPSDAGTNDDDDEDDDMDDNGDGTMTRTASGGFGGMEGSGAGADGNGGVGGGIFASAPRRQSLAGVPFLIAPRVKPSSLDRVKKEWEALKERVSALKPVGRYVVRTVVYRRHLADASDLQDEEQDELAPRWPVAWLVLRPAKYGPKHQLPDQDIVVPIAVDVTLPDYVVKTESYVDRMRVYWQADDRFRIFFGGKISSKTHRKVKTGGMWYKGMIVQMTQAQPKPWDKLDAKEAYDPWESVVVRWDKGTKASDEEEKVSPWEIEIDPEEERRRADEAKRQQQAALRAQRARMSGRGAMLDNEEDVAALEAEAAKLQTLIQQAERAEQLLTVLESKHHPDQTNEEATHNDAAYGNAATQALKTRQAQMGAHIFGNLLGHQAGGSGRGGYNAGQGGTPRGSAPHNAGGAINNIPTGPLKKGQQVPEEVLVQLKPLDSDQFKTMLTNFYCGLKGKFSVPTFARKELDLKAVFWAVMDKGGYEAVTTGKLWKEVCGIMAAAATVDLSGQTSASYNMRLNYERCLLDFENYLACGQYQKDVAAGIGPVYTHLTDPAIHRFKIPGVYENVVLPAGQRPVQPGQAVMHLKLPVAPAAQGQKRGDSSSSSESSSSSSSSSDEERRKMQRFGEALHTQGQDAVGVRVQRLDADGNNVWLDAEITEYNPDSGEHKLTFKKGTAEESFEWADLSEFHDTELRSAADEGVVAMDVDN